MTDFIYQNDNPFHQPQQQQPIYEMVNVAPEDHGFGVNLKMHILQPGDKWTGHGPRVKFFRHNSKTDCILISLHPDASRIAIVARGKDAPATGREENILLAKVKQYRVPLWNMYHDPDMTQRELLLEMGEIDAGRQVLLRGGRHTQTIKL